MARRPFRWIVLAFGLALVCRAGDAQPAITLEQVATGLLLPVAITNAGDGSGRLFITQQCGQILIFDGNGILPTPFLAIASLIGTCSAERGLLSVAFHPNYTNNGYFYVYYTDTSTPYNIVVSRYTVSSDPNVGDPNSAQIVITIPHPTYNNHNGGQLQFGPDGYLYFGTGDGGSAGDPPNNAQNLTVLLGKILRIDIDATGTIPCGQSVPAPYGIPATNPFAGSPPDCPEIWAYGVRNPWRFSFDRSTGDVLIGDVGQDSWEEVDVQPAGSAGGENYGWRLMEGFHCYNPPNNCNDGTLTLPILEYDHGLGCSITGGYRYRGTQYPQLDGTYLYGDYCSGRIWGATQDCSGNWMTTQLLDTPYAISTFGEDEAGEIYLVDYGVGTLYHVASTPDYPLPATSGISPSSAIAGGPGFTLTVNGTGFFPGSVVRWNGSDRATAYVCATQLTASIPASDIAMLGTATVTVFNPAPGGGLSNGQTFNINYPVPATTGISPSSAIVGGPDFTLTVNGTGFFPVSVVRWNGSDRTTTYVSATQLTAAIPASDIVAVGTATVTVFNPAPGGGLSNGQTFTIDNYPVPTTTGISPSSAIVGGPDFTLTVNGTGFFPASVVRWNGSDRTTTYVSSTQLTAAIPASDIVAVGTATVTVFNPAPGGGLSNGQTFNINYPVPATTGISPSSAIVGGPDFTLTVNGTGFFPVSVVRWNGSDRTTTYVSATQLTASIPAPDIAAVGTATVTVFNPAPGGGLSNSQSFNIVTTFVDVPTSYWAYLYIEAIATAGITAGCGGGNYCPEAAVSRAQMAVFLLRAEHGSSFLPPACAGIFQDVECTPTPAFAVDWIEQLAAESITAGCGGGNYCPDNPVTRAEMAVFLLRAEHGSSYLPPACAGIFQDVACTPTPAFAVDWIERLYAEGVTGGCSSSPLLYCPDNPNTRAQMAVFLVKTFNLPLP